MKKFLSLILSILISCCAFAFVGCKNESAGSENNGSSSDNEENKGNGNNGGNDGNNDNGENNDPLPVQYTVKFDLNGGSGSIDDQVVNEGKTAAKPAVPTRGGYDFEGWFTQADGGKLWNFYLDTVNKDTTLYAHWAVQIFDTEGLSYRAIEEDGTTVAYALKGIVEATGAALVVPSEFDGLPVTRIDDYAFYENANITSVTISGNITEIGDSAFYNCEKLESVVLNGRISKMGDLAFAHCLKLETVDIGNEVEEIGFYAFFECESIKEVTIPASVKSIGESAFSLCTGLERVNLNEGLEYIGDCAFGGCSVLEEFIMPQSVTEIGFGMLMFVGGYLYDGETYNGTSVIKKIVMSDNITDIPDFAFSGCAMPTISIGKKVTTINYSSFYGCSFLESVIIPKSVKRIASFAFYRCEQLNTVYYEGTAEEWRGISIGKDNDISTADIYFFSENEPSTEGNFWHYSSDGITPEKW